MCSRAGFLLLVFLAAHWGAAGIAGAEAASTGTSSQRGAKTRFDIAAEPLGDALRDLAKQANINISYEPSAVAGLTAPAVKGIISVDRALALMLGGTGLRAVSIDESTIQIVAANDVGHAAPYDTHEPTQPPTPGYDDSDLEEITVTGTHIRGTVDTPSPTLVFTREDIDATGANTIQQFLQNLPQNVGGVSENTIAAVTTGGKTGNTVNASSPNLRGLGAEATLVLVNGHRVASGNTDASFVDISMIPLSAVERVEIVTDGASAIYGSDAVGGVVNIILRKHFDGEETRAQIGSVTKGAMHDVQIGQTAGRDWGSGSGLLTYQYSDQTSLSASSRDYLKNITAPFSLLPEQIQHAAFANLDQHVTPDFDIHADAAYSHRSTYLQFSEATSYGYQSSSEPSSIDGYGVSVGATAKLPRDSVLNVESTYSESDTRFGAIYSPSPALAYLE
ncbi:MAG TPA: TonB-dependent receptor, partial [Steroidobacteraceae bacterium]|nr:TonB-dependent receptor [Steroidobacteraceae bacterium]